MHGCLSVEMPSPLAHDQLLLIVADGFEYPLANSVPDCATGKKMARNHDSAAGL
jgi:hypothetical protein